MGSNNLAWLEKARILKDLSGSRGSLLARGRHGIYKMLIIFSATRVFLLLHRFLFFLATLGILPFNSPTQDKELWTSPPSMKQLHAVDLQTTMAQDNLILILKGHAYPKQELIFWYKHCICSHLCAFSSASPRKYSSSD